MKKNEQKNAQKLKGKNFERGQKMAKKLKVAKKNWRKMAKKQKEIEKNGKKCGEIEEEKIPKKIYKKGSNQTENR